MDKIGCSVFCVCKILVFNFKARFGILARRAHVNRQILILNKLSKYFIFPRPRGSYGEPSHKMQDLKLVQT